jgi:hypothetical protein
MLRRKIGTTLAACGIVMLMFGVSALPAQGATPSPVRMAPSPRPALAPTSKSTNAYLPAGHITGTVIDLTSGAPVAGVAVNVGGVVVKSDANGNYDRWLPVGSYTVTLALADGQGTPAQDIMTVPVQADVATVQHLNFRSPQTVAAAPAATAQPAAPKAAPAASGATPKRLPRTGADSSGAESYGAWIWLGFGMLLLLAGGLVGFGPVLGGRSPAMVLRAHAANSALLRSLLAAPLRSAQKGEELLRALLEDETRR